MSILGGDASMELTMSAQDDSSPWEIPVKIPAEASTSKTTLYGRGYFSELGVVRRKPCKASSLLLLSIRESVLLCY